MNVVEVKTTIHKYLHLEEKKLINANLASCDVLIIKKEVERCRFIVDLSLY